MISMCLKLLLLLLIIQAVISSPSCNSSTQFDCKIGTARRCIPLEWQCDNVADCENGADEANCNYLHQCQPGMMMCRDGACISMTFKCDGEADCLGGHDEHGCEYDTSHLRSGSHAPEYFAVGQECNSPKYKCKTGNQCISESAICDGVKDCTDGDDEQGCQKRLSSTGEVHSTVSNYNCPFGHRMCADGSSVCIPDYWVCDGAKDCDDGSDEQHCDADDEERSTQNNDRLCSMDEFRCSGGSCIPDTLVCDGKPDCSNGEDEGKRCNECRELGCQYKCHLTEAGSKCYCPDGSSLNHDGVSCSPIDFCSSDSGKKCQHYCENTGKGYSCRCALKYYLGRDQHTCHAEINTEGIVLVGIGSEVRSMPIFDPVHSNDGYKTVKALPGYVKSMSHVHRSDALYVAVTHTQRGQDGELMLYANKTLNVLRQNIIGLDSIAVDYIGGNIYYTQKYPAKYPGIYICSGDGFFCRRIVEGTQSYDNDSAKRQMYRGLVLNPMKGTMVWIESYNKKNKIMMANMDGSNVRILVDNKLEDPRGIALDPIRNEIYYGDFGTSEINRINVNTGERHVVVSRGVHHPYDVKFFDGILYWSDWGSESLKSVEISDHHSTAHTVHTFRSFPMGIDISHPSYQALPMSNPCAKLSETCKWMCVPVPGIEEDSLSANCVCPENYSYSLEQQMCAPEQQRLYDDESHVGLTYMEELCSRGKACLNGGQCVKDKADRLTCSCSAPYTGDRCEVSDPQAISLVNEKDEESSAWLMFWLLFFIFVLCIIAFVFLYRKSSRVNEFTKTTLDKVANLESPDLSRIRPIVDNVKSKVYNIGSHVPLPGVLSTHFSHSQSEEHANPAPVQSTVTFNNPLYSEDQPSSTESFGDYEVSYANKFPPQ